MYRDDFDAAELYQTLGRVTSPALASPIVAWGEPLKLRAYPRRKAAQYPKVRFVPFRDASDPRLILNPALRAQAERWDAAGIGWELYHVNVSTRIPYPRCMDHDYIERGRYDDWSNQPEYLVASSGETWAAWDAYEFPTRGASSGCVALDLETWLTEVYDGFAAAERKAVQWKR